MTKFMLALFILGTSVGFAEAHPAKDRPSYDTWQASMASQTAQRPCFAQDPQMRGNVCGTYTPTGEDISQFNDH